MSHAAYHHDSYIRNAVDLAFVVIFVPVGCCTMPHCGQPVMPYWFSVVVADVCVH